jgi:hypothetical protein
MDNSDFLFARPSFIEGMARVLDMGCTLNTYNDSRTPEEADEKAFKSDFISVFKDLKNSIGHYEQKEKSKESNK